MWKWSETLASQLCLTLCNPKDCSLPGSSVHGIFQARVLEWVAMSFSWGTSQPRGRTRVSHIVGRCFTSEPPGKSNTVFQQHKRRLYTWTSPDGQYRNQIDYILCSQRWRSCTQPAKIRLGADCGSDHEFLIAKFRLKLKEVGKTTRPFKYDLN